MFPKIALREIEDFLLSPICKSRLAALLAFLMKRLLITMDHNERFEIEQAKLKSCAVARPTKYLAIR